MDNENCVITYPQTSQREQRSAALEAICELKATLPALFDEQRAHVLNDLASKIEAEIMALSR